MAKPHKETRQHVATKAAATLQVHNERN